MKRMRNVEDETIPDRWKAHTICKRLKRMPELEEETLDVSGWWRMAEGMCTRAGNLRNQLEKETARVMRRMEVMELDGVMSDSQDWWIRALAWAGVDTQPQSPKTINPRVSCQDQDIILHEVLREASDLSTQEEDQSSQEGREVPLPSIQQEEQARTARISDQEVNILTKVLSGTSDPSIQEKYQS